MYIGQTFLALFLECILFQVLVLFSLSVAKVHVCLTYFFCLEYLTTCSTDKNETTFLGKKSRKLWKAAIVLVTSVSQVFE
jgi:hypothetical protein